MIPLEAANWRYFCLNGKAGMPDECARLMNASLNNMNKMRSKDWSG
jgi:hypothetical protein